MTRERTRRSSARASADPGTPPGLGRTKGGTLTLAYLAEPASLDPAVARSALERRIDHAVSQGLLQYAREPGEAGPELIPCLATEVPGAENGDLSANGLVCTFRLREGVPPASGRMERLSPRARSPRVQYS